MKIYQNAIIRIPYNAKSSQVFFGSEHPLRVCIYPPKLLEYHRYTKIQKCFFLLIDKLEIYIA